MDMSQIMEQAQVFQKKMAEMQDELALKTITRTVGGGMVSATVNGKNDLLELKIDKEVINPAEAEMLQDLVIAAVNDAMKEAKSLIQGELGKITGGMGLNVPGLFG
jgi:DNA-binding YbaB/EbfC family protein